MKRFTTSLFAWITCIGMILLLGHSPAQAAPPQAPLSLTGAVYAGPPPVVGLDWKQNGNGDLPLGYNIYQALGWQSDLDRFTAIGYVADSVNTPSQIYTVHGLAPGKYSFYVTAFNSDGESGASTIVQVEILAVPTISFTTSGPTSATLATPLVYDANATASNNATVIYSLLPGAPTGMVIDFSSGIVRWTPTATGSFAVGIRASATGIPLPADQLFTVVVTGPTDQATLFGTLRDHNGDGIDGARITVNVIGADGNPAPVATGTTLADGSYSIEVGPGTYILSADDPAPPHGRQRFQRVWNYDENFSQSQPADAIPVTVAAATAAQVDFKTNAIRWFMLGGKVRSAEGAPLKMATVEFTGTWLQMPQTTTYSVRTDSNGRYSILLPNIYRYHVRAEAAYAATPIFLPQYYDHVYTLDEAVKFIPTADVDDIDFSLPRRKIYNNGWDGVVEDTLGNRIEATLIAQRVDTFGTYVKTTTDAQGRYSIRNLVPGRYNLLADPIESGIYVGGYYTEGRVTSYGGRTATEITIDTTLLSGSFDVILPTWRSFNGRTTLRGTVVTRTESAKGGDPKILGEEGVDNAMITLIDENETPVASTMTDRDGSFVIEELPAGRIDIVVQKVGYLTVRQELTLTDGEIDVDITLEAQGTSSVRNNGPGAATRLHLYPNPAGDRITLQLPRLDRRATVRVVTMSGMEVYRSDVEAGTGRIDINTSALGSGVYMIEHRDGATISYTPATITR